MIEQAKIALQKVNKIAMGISGICITVIMAYGFLDVSSRYSFNRPLYGTYELSELLMAVVVFLTIASCQGENRHMRVDFLFPYMSKKVRLLTDIAAYICGMIVCGFMGWYSVAPALYSWEISEHTEGIIAFPIYPVKFIIVIGIILLGLQLLSDLITAVAKSRDRAEH